MSRPRFTGARGALSLALLASGAAVLSGCNAQNSANTSAPGQGAASQRTAVTAAAATEAAANTASSYVLTTPAKIGGWTLTAPSSSVLPKMQQGLDQAEQLVGVTGTPVMGLYDDPTDQAWVVFVGVNAAGLDPSKLATVAEAAPEHTMDGVGDRVTSTWLPDEPGGPHGGQTDCNESVIQADDGLATEGADCFWMTPTTFGVVTLYPKADRTLTDFGWSGAQMDGFMLTVRAAVEQSR